MAFKTIMSPAVAAHYPLRIKELFVAAGDMVQPDTRALLAETAQGRKIAIKCGHEGRVIQAPTQDAILHERRMVLVIETFEEEAASSKEGDGLEEAQEEAQREKARKAQAEKDAQEAHQAAYAQASGQKEDIRPAQTEASRGDEAETPAENEKPESASSESQAESSQGKKQPSSAEDTIKEHAPDSANNALSGKKTALVAAGFLILLLGGAVAMQFLDAPSRPYQSSSSTRPAKPAKTKPKILPSRPYPSAEDKDWHKVPNIKSAHFSILAGEGGNAKNIEFLSLDAVANKVLLVGKADNRTIMTSYRFEEESSFHNVRYVGVNPEKAFIVADFSQKGYSSVFISPENSKQGVQTYLYREKKGKPKSISAFKAGSSLLYADQDGGLIALLIEHGETSRKQVFIVNKEGKANFYSLPVGVPGDVLSDHYYYSHLALDTHSKDGIINGTAIVTGHVSAFFNPATAFTYGLRLRASSRKVDFEPGNGQKVLAKEALPKGVFQKYGSYDDKEAKYLGGFKFTASAANNYGQSVALGGYVHGMGNQRDKEGSYRADAYLTWYLANGTEIKRMFVREDSKWRDGLVVRDLEFLDNGRLAVLLREYEGDPYSAVVFFSKNGKPEKRYNYRNAIVNDIDSYRGALYGAGFHYDKGKRAGAVFKF